jgi:uncharacterized membrane protein YjdF
MSKTSPSQIADNVHKWLTLTLQAIIALGLALEIYQAQWLNATLITGILLLTLLPYLLTRQIKLFIPPEFELLAIAFIFASLYLGERRGYYAQFWWWDLVLHATSGGLSGILGFLLVYVLNANPKIDLHLQPGFVAFFAFCFSMTIGVLWEIFEFAMDQLVGTNMQKPMFGDPSGLTDTMWDLIVDALGTLVISLAGYVYMKLRMESFIERSIHRFIEGNPRLFSRP